MGFKGELYESDDAKAVVMSSSVCCQYSKVKPLELNHEVWKPWPWPWAHILMPVWHNLSLLTLSLI